MNDNTEHEFEQRADVGTQRVAKLYAEAYLNAADKRGQADEALEELTSLVGDVFKADRQFEVFLSSSAVGRDVKATALQRIFDSRASELFGNFLQVLNQHERLALIRPILVEAKAIRDERAQRIRVEVLTATPLLDDQREQLIQRIRGSFQMEPLLEPKLDPDMLGGMIVRVGDWLYDASVRTRLETIRTQLIERSSHEIQSRRDSFSTANGN